jgi:hypothetical protein
MGKVGNLGNYGGRDSLLWGKFYSSPVLETKDSLEFRLGKKYCYSLTLPKGKYQSTNFANEADRQLFMKILQKDLDINFPYTATLEDRLEPYYRLVVIDSTKSNKLKSKGSKRSGGLHSNGIISKNVPINEFAQSLFDKSIHEYDYIKNETGINGNIDIELSAMMSDLNDINRALREYGLELKEGKKVMKTLVIRDQPN